MTDGVPRREPITPRHELLRRYLPFLAALLGQDRNDAASLDIQNAREFLAFAHRHSVAPSLAFLLDTPSLNGHIPVGVIESLNAARAAQGRRSAHLLTWLEEIGGALNAAGVNWMLLKGLGVSALYYGGLERRVTRDLDILVHGNDVTSAEAVLSELGIHRASWVPFRALALRMTHAFDYTAAGRTVDLHWALARHVSFRFDLDGLWARRRPVTLGSLAIQVPADEDTLSFYLVSAFSDLQRRGLSARALLDIHRMIDVCDGPTDWRLFLERRRREGTFAITVNMLALVLDVLEARRTFPAVAAAVADASDVVRLDRAGHLALLAPRRFAVQNKLWALPLYDAPVSTSLAWWGASLPLRYFVHRGWQDRQKRLALERQQEFRSR